MENDFILYFVIVFSLPWLFGGAAIIKKRIEFNKKSIEAVGKVVGHKHRPAPSVTGQKGPRKLWAPVIEFKTNKGKICSFTHSTYEVCNNEPCYKLDERLTIRYLSTNPNKAQLNSEKASLLVAVFLIFGGLMFLLPALSGLGLF